jgi:ribonuclease-3
MLPRFKNKKLFEQAFIHRSYLNEVKETLGSNERLELLGDSVLSFVVSSYLYEKYPNFKEGLLTNLRSLLVNTKTLAEVAREIDFGQYLKLSKGEEDSKGRENQSLLADCFEAFIGALFLDQGIDEVKIFLKKTLLLKTDELVQKKSFKDPKSLLQEAVQAKKQSSPAYKVIEEEGPPHARTFTIGVYVNKELLGTGRGKSKQDAEEKAAKEALEQVRK